MLIKPFVQGKKIVCNLAEISQILIVDSIRAQYLWKSGPEWIKLRNWMHGNPFCLLISLWYFCDVGACAKFQKAGTTPSASLTMSLVPQTESE